MKLSLIIFSLLLLITNIALAIPPERPKQPLLSSLYVEPSGAIVAGAAPAGFFRSTDGGSHWAAMASPPSFEQLRHSGLNPAQQICMPRDFGAFWTCAGVSETVSAVDAAGGMYQCADGLSVSRSNDGKRWEAVQGSAISSDKPDHCAHLALMVKKIHTSGAVRAPGPEDDMTVIGIMQGPGAWYATTTQRSTSDLSIRRSVDGGATWTRETFGLPERWHRFSMGRVLSNAVYFFAAEENLSGQQGSLYRSVDGKRAERMNIHVQYGTWVDVQTGPDGAIFVVTEAAIHRSDDGGKTWRALGLEGISW